MALSYTVMFAITFLARHAPAPLLSWSGPRPPGVAHGHQASALSPQVAAVPACLNFPHGEDAARPP